MKSLERYSRQVLLNNIGKTGQEKISRSKVLIVGAGGLGSPCAIYLAAAGVGTIGIIDNDKVAVSNLHRQILHRTDDVGQNKTDSARRFLNALNPEVNVRTFDEFLTIENAQQVVREFDLVVDGSDNFKTRYILNDASMEQHKVVVHGSVFKFQGQVAVLGGEAGACYRCIYPEPPRAEDSPACAEIGVLGVVPGIVGLLQANESLKYILGIPSDLRSNLLCVDLLSMDFSRLSIARSSECPVCNGSSIGKFTDYDKLCGMREGLEVNCSEFQRLSTLPGSLVVDVREGWERDLCHIGGEHIPLATIGESEAKFRQHQRLLFYCHYGQRSLRAATQIANSTGIQTFSLLGGINEWSLTVDSQIPRY